MGQEIDVENRAKNKISVRVCQDEDRDRDEDRDEDEDQNQDRPRRRRKPIPRPSFLAEVVRFIFAILISLFTMVVTSAMECRIIRKREVFFELVIVPFSLINL